MSGLLALCGLALLAQHVAELGSNFHGDHLVGGSSHAHAGSNYLGSPARIQAEVA